MRLTTKRTKRFDVPGDPDGAYINIEALSLNEIARIEAKSSNTGMDEEGKISLTVDPFKRSNGIATACLKGWGGFFDAQGKELKFGPKAVREASNLAIVTDDGNIRFFEWVNRCHDEFLEEIEAENKEASKN